MRLAFIGGGTMAEAMIRSILQGGWAEAQDIRISDPVETRRDHLENLYHVSTCSANLDAVSNADLVILAIKPQTLSEICAELRGHLQQNQIVLSIVAGAKAATLRRELGHKVIVRVMPNSATQIGAGMTVWTCSEEAKTHKETIRTMLGLLGEEIYVSQEEYIDMATALSASGPAYVFSFVEALIDSGVYLGLSRDLATKLTVQTVLGSILMAKETKKHPAQLREMVTSPGGTTAEALRVLEEGGFKSTVIEAVIAAYEKTLDLSED